MARSGPRLEFKGFLSFLILHELKQRRLYGEQLAKRIGARRGSTLLTPGTIYPALKNLRQHRLIKFSKDGRRKIYLLLPAGKTELQKQYVQFGRYFAVLGGYVRKKAA